MPVMMKAFVENSTTIEKYRRYVPKGKNPLLTGVPQNIPFPTFTKTTLS